MMVNIGGVCEFQLWISQLGMMMVMIIDDDDE
jgi:hypothetical protein